VIDADEIAHEMLQSVAGKVAEMFGPEYVSEGRVERKKLGALVFGDPGEKKRLEQLLHPLIREEIGRRAERSESRGVPYFIDIPLFFETGAYDIKRILVVYAPKEIQLERLMKRDGFTKEEAQRRIDAQMDIEAKREKADDLIENTGDLTYLTDQLEAYRRRLSADFKI
jgi:dephospho-CoA kinase